MPHVLCDNLFEELLSLIDKPYEYNHLLAKILCDLVGQSQSQSIIYDGGVPYTVDPTRNKSLSLARVVHHAGAHGLGVTNRYLQVAGDVAAMGEQGILIQRAATITGMTAKSRTTGGWTFEVRKNGANITVASLAVSGGLGSDPVLDIDLNEGDWLQFFVSGTNIGFPVVSVELAWRLP